MGAAAGAAAGDKRREGAALGGNGTSPRAIDIHNGSRAVGVRRGSGWVSPW